MNFVKVTNDVAFRKIFSNENKKEIIISFLNAVLKFPPERQIIDISIENPFQLPEIADYMTTIVDVRVKNKEGTTFLVEMQVAPDKYYAKRLLMYASRSYGNQLKEGYKPQALKPIYVIAILDFNFSQSEHYHSIHRIIDIKTQEHLLKDIEFHFIELKKFTKNPSNGTHHSGIIDRDSEFLDLLEEWVYFVKNAHTLETLPQNIKDHGLKEAYQVANKMTWSSNEQEAYDKVRDAQSVTLNLYSYGKELGIQEGIEKGKLIAKIELARDLKREGMDSSLISKFSGLTLQEIENL